jgi:hypothetical protein
LCDGAVNGSTTVNVFDSGNTQGDSRKCGKAMLLEFLGKKSRGVWRGM